MCCSLGSTPRLNWGVIEYSGGPIRCTCWICSSSTSLVRNGLAGGRSLLDAALGLGIPDAMSATDKDRSRALVPHGGPWSSDERAAILDYCEADVRLTAHVFRALCPHLRVEYALLRGQFMVACAAMEDRGVPIDRPVLDALRLEWETIKQQLVTRIDRSYDVYEAGRFKRDRFAAWLARHHIPWSRLETGELDLSDETFRQAAKM